MLVRALIFLAIAILLFLPFNWLAYRQLVRIHPRRTVWIRAALIVGNLFWPFFLMLNRSTPLMRWIRSTLGPPWILWTMFTLVYALLMFAVLLAWIPLRKRFTFAEVGRWPSRVFLWALIVGSAIGCYQALVPLRVERVSIAIDKLPASLEGKRIAVLGDLHVGLFTRLSRLDRIFTTTNTLRPDVVLLAGDLIDDDPYFVPKLLEGTRTLAASTPLIAVLGNHEMYGDPRAVIRGLQGSRIRLLLNEGLAIGDLWIAGITDFAARDVPAARGLEPNLAEALAAKPAQAVALALAHQPKIFADARRLGVPLAVSAHTHGGQLGFRPRRWSLAGVFLPYHMGLYREGATQLYINTGTGYWLVPFRLGMTPEITLLELRKATAAR